MGKSGPVIRENGSPVFRKRQNSRSRKNLFFPAVAIFFVLF